MSTVAPVTPPVPAEQVNVNMPKEQIAAAVPTPAPAPIIPVAADPTPENPVVTKELGGGQFEVRYLTGETFKGTASEILQKQGQSNYNTHQWAKSEIAKAKEPPPPAPVPTPSPFANEEEGKVAKYVTELQAKELGYKSVDEYKQDLGRIKQQTERSAGRDLSVEFAAMSPEFNGTKENSEKLLNTVETLGLMPLMTSGDINQQLNALRAAHAFALQTKVYEPRPTTQTAPTPIPPPPPIPTTGPVDLTTIPDDLRVDVNMDKAEITRRIELAKSRNYIY